MDSVFINKKIIIAMKDFFQMINLTDMGEKYIKIQVIMKDNLRMVQKLDMGKKFILIKFLIKDFGKMEKKIFLDYLNTSNSIMLECGKMTKKMESENYNFILINLIWVSFKMIKYKDSENINLQINNFLMLIYIIIESSFKLN